MTIQQGQAVKAYLSIQKLNKQETTARTAMKIFTLFNALRKVWDFQVQEEEKLYRKYPEIDPSFGGIRFKTPEEEEAARATIGAFNKDAEEISHLETEIAFEGPLVIQLDDEPGIKLSGEDIGNLAPFIKFQ